MLRSIRRNRSYNIINIVGLSIGLTACIVIFLIIRYELSFDKFHSKYDFIYRIVQSSSNAAGTEYDSSVPYPLANAFRNDFPDIPLVSSMHFSEELSVAYGTDKYNVENVLFVDSTFFDVFDFELLTGRPEQMGEPNKVFLTESLAAKLLKGGDALPIRLNGRTEFEIAGIVADPPAASHINFSMLVSLPSLTSDYVAGMPIDTWGVTSSGYVYVALDGNISAEEVNDRLIAFGEQYLGTNSPNKTVYSLQSLRDIHFSELHTGGPGATPEASYSRLWMTAVLGFFILAIASINFVNLATALSVTRSRSVGIRKTLGAGRTELVTSFLAETFAICLIATGVSLVATEWLLTWLRPFLSKDLNLELLGDPLLAVFLVVLAIVTTLLAGLYPAFTLSASNPITALKNRFSTAGSSGARIRKILVSFQFATAQVLIIGTLVVSAQIDLFESKPLGFDKDAIVNVPLPENQKEKLFTLKNRFETIPGIESFSFSLGAPTSNNNLNTGYFLTSKGKSERFEISLKTCDRHYLQTYGVELVAGRWLTEADELAWERVFEHDSLEMTSRNYTVVLNETAARRLGFADPEDIIGNTVTLGLNDVDAEVVGIVSDFHSASLHEAIEPIGLLPLAYFYFDAGLKFSTSELKETLQQIEAHWTDVFPEYAFEYEFLDDTLASLYEEDQRMFLLLQAFAFIAVLVGCLGLYGLISFLASQRLKEVSIRKVLGASVPSLLFLFSREYIRLIAVAFLISAPVAWYLMSEWLSDFAYRVSIGWEVFALSLILTLLIATLTVSYRSFTAATVNPTDVLKNE